MTAIDRKYSDLGGEKSFLGKATDVERPTPNGLGSYRHYEGGSIYWKHTLPDAFEVHGAIREKWKSLGWENSFLNFPLSDETPVGQGRGRASAFEQGEIVWSPTTGANEVHGAIRDRWIALGREDGGPGFPLTDELVTPDTRGRYNHFENGSIYWTPTTGAHEITDQIKATWAAAGWERGPLGYPTSGPGQLPSSPTNFQDFERGSLYTWLNFSRTSIRNTTMPVNPGGHIIAWSDLEDHGQAIHRLGDDRISFQFAGHPPDSQIRITLNAGRGITWWKAISLWSQTQGDIAEAWTQDNKQTMTISILPSVVEPSNVFLVFKKAMFLGVHTGIYWLPEANRLIGNDVTFTWLADGSHLPPEPP